MSPSQKSQTMHSPGYQRILFTLAMFFTDIFCPNYGWGIRLRGWLASPLLKKCGRNLKLSKGVQIEDPAHLEVGDDVYIGFHSFIGSGPVTIEDQVVIGPFCSITAGNHQFRYGSSRFAPLKYSPIIIGFGSWLAAHVSVVSGVRVGRSCIIAANAVVTENTPDRAVMGGVPARFIKAIEEMQADTTG